MLIVYYPVYYDINIKLNIMRLRLVDPNVKYICIEQLHL